MPKSKDMKDLSMIPKIYRRSHEDIAMFFWVESQRNILPTITIRESIEKFFNFADCDWDLETALVTYSRMKNEFLRNI
jgi:hypothetical protein